MESQNESSISSRVRAAFIAAVMEELNDHFRWSSVEPLVNFYADVIAASAFHRFSQMLEGHTSDQPS